MMKNAFSRPNHSGFSTAVLFVVVDGGGGDGVVGDYLAKMG